MNKLLLLFLIYSFRCFYGGVLFFGYLDTSVSTRRHKSIMIQKKFFIFKLFPIKYRMRKTILRNAPEPKRVNIPNYFYYVSTLITILATIFFCAMFIIDLLTNRLISSNYEYFIYNRINALIYIITHPLLLLVYGVISCYRPDSMAKYYSYGNKKLIKSAFIYSLNKRRLFCSNYKTNDDKCFFFPYIDHRVENGMVVFYLHIDFFNWETHEYEEYIEFKTAYVIGNTYVQFDYKTSPDFIESFNEKCESNSRNNHIERI